MVEVSQLTPEERLDAKLAYLEALADLKRTEKLRLFKPYEPQKEFFNLGATKRERLFMAGNQTGKTVSGAFEVACHLTGLYPDWWQGKRFDQPTRGWIGGVTSETVMEKPQSELCGLWNDPSAFGTGFIPKDMLVGRTLSHGTSGSFDSITVKHVTGGYSAATFKAYADGVAKWQSATLDWVWEDEEPPADIHGEAMTRLTGNGVLFVTCTPLQGVTTFIRRFLSPAPGMETETRGVARMGLRHVSHFTEEQKQFRIAGYQPHLREARMNGDPIIASGQIYTTPEQDLMVMFPPGVPLEQITAHWPKIWGVDFGGASHDGHPFAAALCAIDPHDVFYVLRVLRMSGSTPVTEAAAMKMIAANPPVAWPHDGTHTEKSSGEKLADIYRKDPCSLNMLREHATHATVGGFQVWPGIAEMDLAMRTGKFKVSSTCTEFFDEYRSYRVEAPKKDSEPGGKIHKKDDDVMDAVRCAWMMRRRARPVPFGFDMQKPNRLLHRDRNEPPW